MSEPYWELLGGGGTIGGPVMYAGAWAAGTTYQPGQVVRYNGVDYLAVATSLGQVPPAIAPAITGYGTSLPTTPYDGQEFVLVDSITNPTYQWRFRYNAGSSSAYKWEFIGGPPLRARSDGTVTINAVNTWQNIVGYTLLLPRSGDYYFSGGCNVSHTTAGATAYLGIYIGTQGNVLNYVGNGFPVGGGYTLAPYVAPQKGTYGAGTAIGMSGNTNVAGASYSYMGFTVEPVRVS